MTVDEEAHILAKKLLLVIAGQRVEVAWRATHEVFTSIIALSAGSLGEAKRSAKAAGKDLIDSVTADWRSIGNKRRKKLLLHRRATRDPR